MDMRIPIIAIVGRPNVGKSTFFNRILGEKRAVVEDTPGVTRDRNYGLSEAYRIPFYIVDTGGYEKDSEDELQRYTSEQALLAVEEADAIIFMVDLKSGVQPGDEEVISVLRNFNKPFSVVANKCDGIEHETFASEFYQLGVDSVHTCSALHGRGVSIIIEGILETLPDFERLYSFFEEQKENEAKLKEALDEEWKKGNIQIEQAEDWFEEDSINYHQSKKNKTVIDEEHINFSPVFDPEEDSINSDGIDKAAAEYDKAYAVLPSPVNRSNFNKNSESLSEITNFIINEDFDSPVHDEVKDEPIPCIRIALIGRPNVGKSTILNSLTGYKRAITSSIAGTTRDSIHEIINYQEQQYELIDTAGMRKKGRIGDQIEKYSVLRSMRAISECDVAVVVLDAVEGPSEQDAKILGMAHDQGKGIVLVVNKWDLVAKDHTSVKKFEESLREEFKFVPYAPIYFISGLTGKRVNKILEASKAVALSRKRRVGTRNLNTLLRRELPRASTPSYRGRPLKLYYAAQVDVAPPRFMLVLNYPKEVHFSYLRFIKNTLRDNYGFEGTDIKFVMKKRSDNRV